MNIYHREELFHKHYEREIAATFIVRLKGNEVSEALANRCLDSCNKVGQNAQFFDAVDGTSGTIKYPLADQDIDKVLGGIKLVFSRLTPTEISCFLSHIILWKHCVAIDRPIVILEHDAIMLRKFEAHPFYNAIMYLGNEEYEQYEKYQGLMQAQGRCTENCIAGGKQISTRVYMDRTHAYSIDPAAARQLISKLYRNGINDAADAFITFDEFCIIQPIPFPATVKPGEGTIQHAGVLPPPGTFSYAR